MPQLIFSMYLLYFFGEEIRNYVVEGGEKYSLTDSRLADSLFWHVRAVFGFTDVTSMRTVRVAGDCIQEHV